MSSAEVLGPAELPSSGPPTAESRSHTRLNPLARYLLVRLALIVPMMWFLVTRVFGLVRVIADPIQTAQGGRLSPDQIAERKAEAGLDRPMLTQYLEYLGGIVRGDFGTTLTDNREVSQILVQNGAATLELSVYALIVAFAVGVPLGRLAARHRDRFPDVVLRLGAILVYAAPVFFVGLLLKLAFTPFGWPSSGRASTSTELALSRTGHETHILLLDAILDRKSVV